ncbi:MAG: glycosyltransferase family 4 protein [Clostridium sp.]|nr:glycosyltransferase family 4 protein [Clostridium sp.]
MNIGLFTETYYPEINGVAASVYVLKEELEKQGHNVYVFTTTSPNAPQNEKNVYRVHSLPCILISDRRVGLLYQRKIAAAIKKLKLDIIHTNTEFSLGVFGRIMAKELKIPIIHTYHTIYEDYTHYVTKGIVFDQKAKKAVRLFSKVCCNKADEVIVPTDKVKEILQNYHVTRSIEVIPTGINLDKFDERNYSKEQLVGLRASYGIKENDKVILYLGRVSREKNIQELLKYMPGYLGGHKDVKFVLVGDGPDGERLREYARSLSCSNQILFIGERPYDEVGQYYQIGDVFVSASNSETQGLTFIEAMASGLPVVAKEDRCLEGIMKEGNNGHFFRSEKEFHSALDNILYSGRQEEYSECAKQTAHRFSTQEFANEILHVYENVLMRREENEYDREGQEVDNTESNLIACRK